MGARSQSGCDSRTDVRSCYGEEDDRFHSKEVQCPCLHNYFRKWYRYPSSQHSFRQLQKKYEVTYEKHIAELGQIRKEALKKGAWSAAVNAEVARGKAAGLYIEQKIIRTGKLEDLTTEELESRMKKIIDDYSPILEDVPFEEIKDKVKSKQESQKNSLHLSDTADGEDVPVGE